MEKTTLDKLHYQELKNIVKGYCSSNLGKELIDKLKPSSNMKVIKSRLDKTSEGRRLLGASYHIPFDGIQNVSPLIEKIEKGAALDAEDLIKMSDFLRGCRKLKMFMENKEGYAPTLVAYSGNLTSLLYIEEEINTSILGNRVASNASKELKKIRRQIDIFESRIKEKLDKFLKNSSNKQYIQEFFVSERNGKYTVPIKAEYKNQVAGSVIENSAKGNTVFIELNSVSKSSGELAIYKVEETIEEYKILSMLTEMLYEHITELKINIEVIAEYDMVWAKTKYSNMIGGIAPKINDHGYIKIVNGSYPLLENGVPLNFEIGDNYRTLIITGPNAGGKTVVLKTLGMMALAVQSGFHIKADEETEISVFERIFVDIGDDQSVENALSTFSSHVKNLAHIISNSNKSSLLLFDEIGSGTEPNEGAALAIAILEEVYHRGCITVATTHYGEIKNYSANHPDFENAAMEFENDTLEPLYKLHIGKSGNSNALYISKKMGIMDNIIQKTKVYIDTKNYNYNLINQNKVKKEKIITENVNNCVDFEIGDRAIWLEKNEPVLIYKKMDEYNNITVLYKSEFIEINHRRLQLEAKASDLYPLDYDLDQLFIAYKDRKLERDINRGSKKALKRIQKEIKNRDNKKNN